jgi:two-component system phosphate regulon sensor histidine kinase PhoR
MNGFFYLGFRLALRAALWLLPVTFLLFWVSQPWQEALLLALYASVATSVIVYLQARALLVRRFNRILNELKDISERHFADSEETYFRKDELDDVVLDTRDTARTVENELQRLNKLENYRKEFIGDISHELKTPIFAVQGYIETLINGALNDPTVNERFLQKAMNNVNRLTELTHDLLEISRIETGDIKSNLVPIELKHMIVDVMDGLQLKAHQDSISLVLNEFDASIRVMADRTQLKQVLVNLIENAIKYNQAGGMVTVGVKTYPKNPSKVLVYIKDTGMGIEPHYLNRVTERFFRTEKSRAREQGGSGLGLAIVKHIIEAHHEQLIIESTVGKGSTFSFTLQNTDRVSLPLYPN